MFSFQLYNCPISISLDSSILESIFITISEKNPIEQKGIINIVFVSDEEMQELNKQYRNKDATTDVLSFHYFEEFGGLEVEDVAGEILLSESKVLSQAKEYEHTPEAECYKLISHGVLHIIGYDHETDEEYAAMHPREIEVTNMIRDKFQLRIVD